MTNDLKNKLFAFYKADGNTQKSKFAYSAYNQELTALFLVIFDLFCLTSHSTNEQTAEKCIIFAEEKLHLSKIFKQA